MNIACCTSLYKILEILMWQKMGDDEIRSGVHSQSASTDVIGAVVIGRNEGARLVACIGSLNSVCSTVVYVDSGSVDASVTEAKRLGAKVVQLDLSKPFTAARARNSGFQLLRESNKHVRYVQFVDGDCEVVKGWLTSAERFLDQNPDIALVCGNRIERYPAASIYNGMCSREWNTPSGATDSSGGDFMIRAQVFQEIGGFADEQVAHEEPEFCGRLRKAGFRIWKIDIEMTLHDAAIHSLKQFYSRNRRAGFGITQALARSGMDIDPGGRAILQRAATWALIIPTVILIGLATLGWIAAPGLVIYPAQVVRHAVGNKQCAEGSLHNRFAVATLAMVGKFAEAQGALEYLFKLLLRREMKAIYYR